MSGFFERRCPVCNKVMRALTSGVIRCVTCGIIGAAALDPHAHNHVEKYRLDTSRLTVVTSTSSANDTGGAIFTTPGFKLPNST